MSGREGHPSLEVPGQNALDPSSNPARAISLPPSHLLSLPFPVAIMQKCPQIKRTSQAPWCDLVLSIALG